MVFIMGRDESTNSKVDNLTTHEGRGRVIADQGNQIKKVNDRYFHPILARERSVDQNLQLGHISDIYKILIPGDEPLCAVRHRYPHYEDILILFESTSNSSR